MANSPAKPVANEPAELDDEPPRKGLMTKLSTLLVETRSVMPSAGATGLSLVLVIAAMCFLASLALGAALSVSHVTSDWTRDLSGALTIEVKQTDAMLPEEQIRAVLYVLSQSDGVLSAKHLTMRT